MRSFPVFCLFVMVGWNSLTCRGEGPILKYVGSDPRTATSQAIRVDKADLIHTAQLVALDVEGIIFGKDNFEHQAESIFSQLKAILVAAGSDVDKLVRVHLYLKDAKDGPLAMEVMHDVFRKLPYPSVTMVSGKLPHPDALLAVDVVAAAAPGGPEVQSTRVELLGGQAQFSHAKRLPMGKVLHIAGQAEKGANLVECTRNTLGSLQRTLEWMGLSWQDVVSIKCFMTPMEQTAEVRRTVSEVLGGKDIPPVVCVDWISTLPIEIEVVASANRSNVKFPDGINVMYLTPPGMTRPTVYSRATVLKGPSVYLSGVFARDVKSADEETRDLFVQLEKVLKSAGSDFQHLVKATYYCREDGTSKALNALRPNYYSPESPPAASKAITPGVGRPDRNITLDLIAVPAN
ncbi:MAG: Rid family hydrolase [Planctomycetales bacterium]